MKHQRTIRSWAIAFVCLLSILNVVFAESTIAAIPSSITFIKHSLFSHSHYFCRIHGACRVGDGRVLLPIWMKEHAAHIAHCGFANVSYSITSHNSSSTSVNEGSKQEQARTWKSMLADMELNADFRGHDLLGGPTPSAERADIALVITPLIHIIDLFSRPSAYSSHTSALCITEKGKVPCTDSNPLQPAAAALNPLLLIDSRIAETKDFKWPKSMLRLMRSSLAGNFRAADQREVYSWKVRHRACCFRSLLSTNVRTSDMPSGAISSENLFFTENGLARTSAAQLHHAIARCVVKVLLLNRYGRRFIEGANLLSSAITAFSNVLAQTAPHVQIRPEIIFFENSSFHEQVSVVQEAGVIVATHGESNANLMFARPETNVFEILPFGFLSDDYKNLSSAYGVRYQRVTAQPDKQVFKACISHFNTRPTQEREQFLNTWELYADTFRNGTIEHGRNILSSYVLPEYVGESPELPETVKRVRDCAAFQRVSVDVRDLARSVVVSAAKQCPIHTDLTMLQI